MITDKMIEVIRAFQDGKTIQVRFANDERDEWQDCDPEPMWNFDEFDYRAKPEEVVVNPEPTKYYQYLCRAEDGSLFLHKRVSTYEFEGGDNYCGYPVIKRMLLGTLS